MIKSFQIENLETGERCRPGEEGEICVKTLSQMTGFLNPRLEVAEFKDFEGFGHTGDLGRYSPTGEVVHTGKMADLIR